MVHIAYLYVDVHIIYNIIINKTRYIYAIRRLLIIMRRYRRRYPFSSNFFEEETKKTAEDIFLEDFFAKIFNMCNMPEGTGKAEETEKIFTDGESDTKDTFSEGQKQCECLDTDTYRADFNFFKNDKDIYVLEIPLPGQSPVTIDENVKIEITHEQCTITINNSDNVADIPDADRTYYVHGFQKEKYMSYTIHFPEEIDIDTAKTHYDNGLLTITVHTYSPSYQDEKRNLVITPSEM